MPAGHDVRPAKWSESIDLFDNGRYSAVWGHFEESPHKCLGVRWNGSDGEGGFPNQGVNPLWYVEPPFLTEPILQALLTIVQQDRQEGSRKRDEYVRNLKSALKEFREPWPSTSTGSTFRLTMCIRTLPCNG